MLANILSRTQRFWIVLLSSISVFAFICFTGYHAKDAKARDALQEDRKLEKLELEDLLFGDNPFRAFLDADDADAKKSLK